MNAPSSKIALVTGAAAGIGLACARRFAAAGYSIILNDLPGNTLERVTAELDQPGSRCIAVPGDISDPGIITSLKDSISSTWGRVDALVANAGVQDGGTLLDTDEKHWERVLSINLMGVVHASKSVLPFMLEQEKGAIVFTASVNAISGSAGMPAYDASKTALLGLMRSLAIDHGKNGVRVNSVSPGNTITDFHINRMAERGIDAKQLREMTQGYAILGRAAEAPEIANAVYFLASDEASFITGHNLVVDGGFSLGGDK